jgi:hypothetical protein
MTPGTYDYEVEGGDCLPLYVTLKDENEAAISLVGYSSRLVITWPGEQIILTTDNERLDMGEDDSPAATGVIEGELAASETDRLPYGRIAQYEWSVTQPSGCKLTFMKGFITRT